MVTDIKIGLIARADRTGLGYQTRALYKLLNPTKVLLINATFKGTETNYDWYPNALVSDGFPSDRLISEFLTDIDVAISCEIPYNYSLFTIARQRGIKTILQPNAELNQYFSNRSLPKPDMFFLPSHWLERETRALGVETVYCPPPVDIEASVNMTVKESGNVNILHVAGKKAFLDRNGSDDVECLRNIAGINLTVTNQSTNNFENNADIYKGDYHYLLIPRKYGGLCLPMLESLSQQLPVIMTDIPPNNLILPKSWLVSTLRPQKRMMKRAINVYENNRQAIINKALELRDKDNQEYQKDIETASKLYESHQKEVEMWHFYINKLVKGSYAV